MGKTNFSIYMEIKQQLVKKLSEEHFEHNKLPPETELAKELEISLVTLREALMMLALEGYITKRHGSGNYVHPSAFDPTHRNDLGITFADSFRQQGYEPDMQIIGVRKRMAREEYGKRFGISEEAVMECAEVLYTADGLPAIYSVQSLPAAGLRHSLEIGRENWDIHEFVREYCGVNITHALNEYKAIEIPGEAAEILGLPAHSPVLYCEQLFYDIHDNRVMFNVHYFHPERYGVRMLQNWDLNAK